MNFLSECLEDFQSLKLSQGEFREQVCARCRNGKCEFSPWKDDIFAQRVQDQPGRFFNPLQADPTSSKYKHLVNFESLLHRAMQLEVADRKGNWEIPEIPIVDGRIEPASTRSRDQVEQAVRSLRGEPEPKEEPVSKSPPEPEEPLLPSPSPVKVTRTKKAPEKMPTKGNVSVPDEGLMIGGGPIPTKTEQVDPWAPKTPGPKIVPPGARIRFGLTGEINDGN